MSTQAPLQASAGSEPSWRDLRPQIVTTLAVFAYFTVGIPYAMTWLFGAAAPVYFLLLAAWVGFGVVLWRVARRGRTGLAVVVTLTTAATWVVVVEAGLAWWGWSTSL